MEDTREILQEEDGFQHNEMEDKDRGETKSPRRIIYFANGETMEQYSTEEEEEEEEEQQPQPLDTSKLSWGLYLRLWAVRIATTSLFTCEFLGGKLATLFGLNEPKYQYAIDEYYRTQKKESEDDEDGEKISETNEAESLNEKDHLEVQSVEYGSIRLKDAMEFSQRSTFANINEASKHDLQSPNCISAVKK
ncbi:LYR motif-containing protein 4 [Platysternon megacephalum]|uniref:LYR motif-containing protein 4 n=1 Tax=Platysternon megacephalum TaxID=55544 RepID=A0A4D9EL71_9SAUR|nr:LYR motif-containing protein 4 [Platysternon megacephalum]